MNGNIIEKMERHAGEKSSEKMEKKMRDERAGEKIPQSSGMKFRSAFMIFMMLMAMASLSWADITFTSSSVTPSTLRPGVSGTATFTVTNTGTTAVTGLSFDISGYGFDLPQQKIVVGDIGAGGSTQVTIPFRIRTDVPAGVYTLQASTLLTINTGSTTGITARTFSVPVSVSSPATFEVSSSADRQQISPGGEVKLHLIITNRGGKASNVRISANSSNFIIKDTSQVAVGNILPGDKVEADIVFTSSSSLSGGTYSIPIKLSYEDDLGVTNNDVANVGPILVVKGSADFGLKASTSELLYPGDKAQLTLDLQNNGGDVAYSAIVSIAGDRKSSDYFVALDSAEQSAGDFAAGEKKQVAFQMGVNGNTPPGYYALNATITYVNAQGEQARVSKLFGVEVLGRYDVSVIADPSPRPVVAGKVYSLSVQVSNTGSGDLKAVSAELAPSSDIEVIGTPYGFIGELQQGDYSSAEYDVYVRPGLESGRYPLRVNVTFFDAYNAEHTVTKVAYVDVVSPQLAALAQGTSTGPSTMTVVLVLAVLAAGTWYANRKGRLDGVKARLGIYGKGGKKGGMEL